MIGSLCSGYGGLDLAAEALTGLQVAWVADNNKHAARILAHHWPHVPNLGDLTAIDWTTVPPVKVVTAGYPCQPFSHAGNRKGTDDDRHLWPHVAACVRALRPRLVLLENVEGHVSLGLDIVLGDLAEAGYDARWGCLRAADVGAPHNRERVFIAATDACSGSLERPGAAGNGLLVPTQRGHVSAADTCSERHGRGQDGGAVGCLDGADGAYEGQARERERARPVAGDRGDTDWGRYGSAIERWERTTRRAPRPTESGPNGKRRVSAAFMEWMMGLPAGWVTDTGIPYDAQRTALGNGVVPQQALEAYRLLGVG